MPEYSVQTFRDSLRTGSLPAEVNVRVVVDYPDSGLPASKETTSRPPTVTESTITQRQETLQRQISWLLSLSGLGPSAYSLTIKSQQASRAVPAPKQEGEVEAPKVPVVIPVVYFFVHISIKPWRHWLWRHWPRPTKTATSVA